MECNTTALNYSCQWNDSVATSNRPFSSHNDSLHTYTDSIQSRFTHFLTKPHQILAVALSVAAILINVLSLLAILRVKLRLTTRFLFIVSLAISDIMTGVSKLLWLCVSCTLSYHPPNRAVYDSTDTVNMGMNLDKL